MNNSTIRSAVAALSFAALCAGAETTFDVQFEANGLTYTLYDQTFPIELTVDGEWGNGSLDDILVSLFGSSIPPYEHSVSDSTSTWVACDRNEASLAFPAPNEYAYTLTIARPFSGTVELNGRYEGTETVWEWDEMLQDYIESSTQNFGDYCVLITLPSFTGVDDPGAIIATAGDVGKVIGANGGVYATAQDAEMAGTTAEAMIAYLNASNHTGLAIALSDAGNDIRQREAADAVANWSYGHQVNYGAWRLPSLRDWQYIFAGCGGEDAATQPVALAEYDIGSFHDMLAAAGGQAVRTTLGDSTYFSSTKTNTATAWAYDFLGPYATYGAFTTANINRFLGRARACLAFEFVTPGYGTWAMSNAVSDPWNFKDQSGIHNVFRYAFNVPWGDFPTPLLSIFIDAAGKAVVTTPELVNTNGFAFSILASDDVAGAVNAATYPLAFDGTNTIDEIGGAARFFRLKAEELPAE